MEMVVLQVKHCEAAESAHFLQKMWPHPKTVDPVMSSRQMEHSRAADFDTEDPKGESGINVDVEATSDVRVALGVGRGSGVSSTMSAQRVLFASRPSKRCSSV